MRLHKLFLIPSLSAAFALGACGAEEPEPVQDPALEEIAPGEPEMGEPRLDPEGAILDDGVAEGQVLEPTVDPGPDSIPAQGGTAGY